MPPKRPRTATATGTPAPYRVFVSHATPDKWIARMICEKIDAIPGVSTFRDDRDIEGGDDIPETLRNKLSESDELFLLLTALSVERKWVMLEVGTAWGLKKKVVPVCYNATIEQVPILSKVKAYALNDFDRYLAELRSRIERRRK